MKIKKFTFAFCAVLIISLMLSMQSFAGILSPAMSVISENFGIKISGMAGKPINFSESIISNALGSKIVTKLKIVTLPDEHFGKLTLGERDVAQGEEIPSSDFSKLVFTPTTADKGAGSFFTEVCSFGQEYRVECTLVMLENLNLEPKIEKNALSVTTYSNVALYGRLEGKDPENDEITFEISTYPRKGLLTVGDKNKGTFVYEPYDQASGSDCFEYKICDAFGNESRNVTVKISIDEPTGKLYSDMSDNEYEYYATFLSENGIFKGVTIGNERFFRPDEKLSVDEFREIAKTAVRSGNSKFNKLYSDDKDVFSDAENDFISEISNEITFSMAAEILDTLCRFDAFSDDLVPSLDGYSLPVALFISNTDIDIRDGRKESDPITRAQAAEMIVKALFE